MAQQSLLDYLAGPALNELMLAMDVQRGVPDVLPTELYTEATDKPFSDKVIWDHRTGQRSPATIVNPLSPSRQFNPPAQQRAEATCITAREHVVFDAETVQLLKANVPIINDRIKRKVAEDMRDFKERFAVLRKTAVMQILFNGQINYLPRENGTAVQPDLQGGVPTSAGQFVAPGTSGAVTVGLAQKYHTGGSVGALTKTSVIPNAVGAPTVGDWSNASTNLPAAIRAFQEGFEKTNNYRIGNIIYGRSIPDYFASNTEMQTFMSRQPVINQQFQDSNEVPTGLLGVRRWIPGWRCYWQDYTGAIQSPCAANQIIIFPEIDRRWYEFVPGGVLVPTGIVTPGMSMEQAIGQSMIVNGYHSYADWIMDPYSLKLIVGDCFLPIAKIPTAIWSITVS